MARLNTAAPPKPGEPRLRPNPSLQTGAAPSRAEPKTSIPKTTKRATQWKIEREVGTAPSKFPLQRSQSQRSGKSSGSSFDIFNDADEISEKEDKSKPSSKRSSGSNDGRKAESKPPLKLAKVNSMLLPVPQQTRTRPSRKSELDYDKENDMGEEEADEPAPTASDQQQPPTGQDRDLGQILRRTENSQQFQGFREPAARDGGSSASEDNAFDSMDDFIVSDNEELSYYDTSEAETDDDVTPPSPPPTRRRLFRGRRPDPESEVREKEALRLGPSLSSKLVISSLASDSLPKGVSQNELDVEEKMHGLSLDNNDASSQLEKDLHL